MEPIRRIRDKLGTGSKQNASSNTPNKFGPLAQLVERSTVNRMVPGSSLGRGAKLLGQKVPSWIMV